MSSFKSDDVVLVVERVVVVVVVVVDVVVFLSSAIPQPVKVRESNKINADKPTKGFFISIHPFGYPYCMQNCLCYSAQKQIFDTG